MDTEREIAKAIAIASAGSVLPTAFGFLLGWLSVHELLLAFVVFAGLILVVLVLGINEYVACGNSAARFQGSGFRAAAGMLFGMGAMLGFGASLCHSAKLGLQADVIATGVIASVLAIFLCGCGTAKKAEKER